MAKFETKQKSKYKVDFNFNFISIEKKIFWKYPKYFGENPGTNQNLNCPSNKKNMIDLLFI